MNKYQILQEIGQGEYGQVMKARNKQTNQIVAIKKFKDDENDQQTKKIILREVKVLKMMKQQNITDFKQAFRKKGKVYLVCEYVEHNLLYLIDENKGIEKQRVKEYISQILKGIAYMHSIDLIHRDIKPENILINSDNSLKICDFGFTRLLPAALGDMTQYVATRWYRPPQLLIGVTNYDQSVDVWAVGCLFGEMIDGDPLFPGQSQIDQLYLIQKMLGGLTPQHQELFNKNPNFQGIKFAQTNCNDMLERRYLSKLGKQGLDLMKKMLKMNPSQRISASQALKHPYFTKQKPRVSRSPIVSDYYDKPKLLTASNNPQPFVRQKPHISMLGINKIKGANRQSQDGFSNSKYKLAINIQNKQNNNSVPKQQKVQVKSRKEPILKKKSTKQTYTQNYVLQFDDQQFVQAASSKPKEILKNKRKIQNYEQDPQQQRFLPKTPILGKFKGKKKISKYDHDQDYDGPNLVFQRKKDAQDNIIFNSSNLNCY